MSKAKITSTAPDLSNTVLAECSINVFLDYEIRSSSWAHYIGIEWMQEISGKYFAWKVRRKYARYLRSKMWEQRIKNFR